MEKVIYVKLIEEGTRVYRPVTAIEIKNNVYQLFGHDLYDPEDEIWEFKPGEIVIVEEFELGGEKVLVAINKESN